MSEPNRKALEAWSQDEFREYLNERFKASAYTFAGFMENYLPEVFAELLSEWQESKVHHE
jgi:hypothetical protein